MATDPVIPIEELLEPIREDAPTGDELSKDDPAGPYYRVYDAWSAAKKAEREIVKAAQFGEDGGGEELQDPDWHAVIENAEDVLRNNAKDFRVASWYTEALLRIHGFGGLRDGFKLCQELANRYWDQILPAPNEDGHELTVSGFDGLTNEANFAALLAVPFTDGTGGDDFSVGQYQASLELDGITDAEDRSKRAQQGVRDLTEFELRATETNGSFYTNIVEDLGEAISILYDLSDFFRSNCSNDSYDEPVAPATTEFRNKLEQICKNATPVAARFGQSDDAGEDGANSELIEYADNSGGQASPPRQLSRMSDTSVADRNDAFEAIRGISRYFRTAEPNSPVADSLDRIVRWKDLSFFEIAKDLIEDHNALEEIRNRVGIPPEPEADE
ncbi:MAG: type VI secretion system protein ImpA [Pirellulaceae bacterium]|jgi:type VI secretion system protein ImpA